MNYSTILSLFLGYVSITQVSAEPATPPLKARINSEVFKRVIHKRDQEMLKVFADMSLTPGHGEAVTENRLGDLRASLTARDGIAHEDLDFELHVESDYFGAESSELQYEGTGTVGGEAFSFKGPVELLKLQYALGDTYNADLGFE
jgi:hypothetical protein